MCEKWDLVTKFDSKLLAIKQLEHEIKIRKLKNIVVSDVIVLLDREQGVKETAKEYGINLHSLIPFMSKGLKWLRNVLSDQEYKIFVDYLENPLKYQDPHLQKELSCLVV